MAGSITIEMPGGNSIVQDDVAARGSLDRLASCHELLACLAEGATLPPLWHWLHFLDAAPPADLGEDGHRRRGLLVPHDPALPTRMWAGGRLHFLADPDPGSAVRRTTTVHDITARQGRRGMLRFVTLRHVVSGVGGTLVAEEQDLVFRAPAGLRGALPPVPNAEPPGAVTRVIVPDAVLLFRFSALTFNAHRIHYDYEYARAVEHYPGLVVHGPLQAILLTALLRQAAPGATLRRFEFRAQAPAFADRPLQLAAWPDDARPGHWCLQTCDAADNVCMVAQAETAAETSAF